MHPPWVAATVPNMAVPMLTALFALFAPASAAPTPAPSPEADTPADAQIDLLSANLWGLAWPLARDRGERLPKAPEALGFDGYDFVGLQEIWRGAVRHLPEGAVRVPSVGVDSGLAVAGQLSGDASIALHTFEASAGVERFKRKGVLVAQLDVPDFGPLWVYVTHLQAGPPYGAVRMAQAEELIALMERTPGPAVVMGDFNLHAGDPADDAVAARLAEAGLVDAALSAGAEAPTYRSGNPYIWGAAAGERFDRIFLRDGAAVALELVEVEVLDYDVPLSDHQPVRARVQLREQVARAAADARPDSARAN